MNGFRQINPTAAIVTMTLHLFLFPGLLGAAAHTVGRLRCEYRVNPLGIDVPAPRLSWVINTRDGLRGARQTAYRVLVASNPAILSEDRGDLWDSDRVLSDQSAQLAYAGKRLRSSQLVHWKIRIWDEQGRPSAWSRPANWTMGVLNDSDWHAKWITAKRAVEENSPFTGVHTLESAETHPLVSTNPPTYPTMILRREFSVRTGLQRAVVHFCGLGQYELTLNSRRAGDDLLTPGWTKYDKTTLYDTYDVTPLLRVGNNTMGVLLGNGMYNVRGGRYTKFRGSFGEVKVIGQLRLEYADGTSNVIGTDEQWRVHPGPITFSCVYGGEDYDARLEPIGWDQAGFDDANWEKPVEVRGPGGKLTGLSGAAPPVRAFEILKPVHLQTLPNGTSVYDLGQNASFMPRIKVKGSAGAVVRIIPAELIHNDGSVDRGSSGGGQAYWQYTMAGKGEEEWFPKFFYHGCRYLQVECTAPDGKDLPVIESIEGVVVHSSSEAVGDFSCSNDLFNRIHGLIRWAQRSNMMHVLTDCPHRERLGWLEQYHLNGPSLRYEFDLAALFTKGMKDMADSQLENGLVPDIAPEYVKFEKGFRDSPEWGSAFLLTAWQQYEWTGDLELLRMHYMAMKRYVDYLRGRSKDYLLSHGLGDWYDLGPKPPGEAQLTPVALTATAFYHEDAATLAKIARLLGHADDAGKYEELARRILEAFNKEFFDSAKSQYAQGSQCANAVALVMGLVEPVHRAAVLDSLVEDICRRRNALTTGDVGYRYLLRALADGDRSNVIFAMNNQSENPGYGYQLKQGATSLTEAWDAGRASSQNHFMLGHLLEWFYHDLAGISCDPTVPAFKKIIIRPATPGDLKWVKARYDSIYGRIESNWAFEEGEFKLEVVVPANTTATVYIPGKAGSEATEGGKPAAQATGVRYLGMQNGSVLYEVASGRYRFLVE